MWKGVSLQVYTEPTFCNTHGSQAIHVRNVRERILKQAEFYVPQVYQTTLVGHKYVGSRILRPTSIPNNTRDPK